MVRNYRGLEGRNCAESISRSLRLAFGSAKVGGLHVRVTNNRLAARAACRHCEKLVTSFAVAEDALEGIAVPLERRATPVAVGRTEFVVDSRSANAAKAARLLLERIVFYKTEGRICAECLL